MVYNSPIYDPNVISKRGMVKLLSNNGSHIGDKLYTRGL